MNKRTVERYLPIALQGLCDVKNCKIVSKGKCTIRKGFRGQISSFGAAVTMGSFKAAVAFYGRRGNADTLRPELLRLMYYIVNDGKSEAWKSAEKIIQEILNMDNADVLREKYENAAIAIKLALNAFELE